MAGGYSKYNPSLQVIKRRAGQEPLPRPVMHTVGPAVNWYTIKVPHAGDNAELEAALIAKGFERVGNHWERDTSLPLDGRVYGSMRWLDWARRRYRAAWPWFRR